MTSVHFFQKPWIALTVIMNDGLTVQGWKSVIPVMKKYNKNEIPNYDGETPVKKDSERFTYRFRGWTPEITAVVADTYYTAKYDSAYRMYDIYFVDRFNHDGFVSGEWVASYRYGTAASVVASGVPALAAVVNGNCTYTFKKWDNPIEDVTAIAT